MENTFHRSQFTFYASYFNAIEHLPKTRRYEALRAVIRYALEGELPEGLTPAASGVFDAIRPNLDAARVKASARISARRGETFDSPGGKNKRENKEEKKNETECKNEIECKNETECKSESEIECKSEIESECKNKIECKNKTECESEAERENEPEQAGEFAPAQAARETAACRRMTLSPPEKKRGAELSRLAEENPVLGRILDQMLDHWERAGQPLTAQEKKLMAWSLAVHSPEEQSNALLDAMSRNSRQISFSPGRRQEGFSAVPS